MQEKPAWKQWNDRAGLLVGIRKHSGASTWTITGTLHGVNLPWMEVIDEADGLPVFQCFGAELLRARHGLTWGETGCTLGISSG